MANAWNSWENIKLLLYAQLILLLDQCFYALYLRAPISTGRVDGVKLERLSPWEKDFKWAKDKMNNTIAHDDVKSYSILKVYRIKNSTKWQEYLKRRKAMSKELNGEMIEEKRLFHGSPETKKIAHEGFNSGYAKSSGMFGPGIYFAEHSSKSNNYVFGLGNPCETHENLKCHICFRRILICRVALGKIYEAKDHVRSPPPGYHSVKAIPQSGLRYPEYITYNDAQVYPSYLVEYRAMYDVHDEYDFMMANIFLLLIFTDAILRMFCCPSMLSLTLSVFAYLFLPPMIFIWNILSYVVIQILMFLWYLCDTFLLILCMFMVFEILSMIISSAIRYMVFIYHKFCN